MQPIDLHIHTSFSDGKFQPEEIIQLANKAGMWGIGITDHDSVNGIKPAIEAGNKIGIEVIPGIEFSTLFNGKEVHILGYFIDYNNKNLLEFISQMKINRLIRLKSMIEKLNSLRLKIDINDVLDLFNGDISYGRPHLAIAMLKKGLVKNYFEAFIKYIGDSRPACVVKENPPTSDVLKLIDDCGGLSFVAHPGKYINDSDVYSLINEGLDGIEIIHPSHTAAMTKHYLSVASEYFLLQTGGSDFHGIVQQDFDNFGKFHVTAEEVSDMKVRLL